MRRLHLLSTVSQSVLSKRIPAKDSAMETMAHAVRAICDLITLQSLIGFDFCDAREILQNGGRATFAQGSSSSHLKRKTRLPMMAPRLAARP